MNTPENITELKENQIIIVGTNWNGNHAGGAAKFAKENFGLEDYKGEGLSGLSYAFPTLGWYMERLPFERLCEARDTLYKCCLENPEKEFLLTKVGCGIAGIPLEEMKSVFNKYYRPRPENLILPIEFN